MARTASEVAYGRETDQIMHNRRNSPDTVKLAELVARFKGLAKDGAVADRLYEIAAQVDDWASYGQNINVATALTVIEAVTLAMGLDPQ